MHRERKTTRVARRACSIALRARRPSPPAADPARAASWRARTTCRGPRAQRAPRRAERYVALHVARDTQPLESVLAFVVHCTSGTLAFTSDLELGNDFGNRCRARCHGESDFALAQRTETFAVTRKVELAHGNAFALDVAPDIDLGPCEQRMSS